jgi:hypothetical protein
MHRITFYLSYPSRFTTHLSDPGWGSDPPQESQGAAVHVFSVDGGHPQILWRHLPGGPSSSFFSVDVGRSQIL